MPTPAKPVDVLLSEGKSHRTKAELMQRKQAEESLLSGARLKEDRKTKESPIAHKEFLRVKKLLRSIEKDDDLYGAAINRYCILKAEEQELIEHKDRLCTKLNEMYDQLSGLHEESDIRDMSASLANLEKTYASLDGKIQAKRKMQAEIEKENIMTISAALRSVPKKIEEGEDPLLKVLSG